jgi:hypothetical protein
MIISSDKMQLTLFHDKQAYPIYLTIGNIPKDICQKPSCHGQLLVAYLPTTKLGGCYRLGKRLNCLVVGAIPPGFAVYMTCVSYMSRASVRGPVGGHRLSQSILLGYLNLVSG